MKIQKPANTKQVLWLQILLILTWVTCLRETDSYFFICALIACAGKLCAWENHRIPEQTAGKRSFGCYIVAGLFSLSTVLANYALFEPETALMNLFEIVCCLVGGWIIGINVLTYFLRVLPVAMDPSGERKKAGKVFLVSFATIVCVDLVFLLLVEYPAVVTSDSLGQLGQILSENYDNRNPYWHTRTMELFIKPGMMLTGDFAAGIALFTVVQIVFMAGCFSYVIMTLYQKGIPGWIVTVVWVLYALMPYHISYSVTIWKDIPFSGASLLLITSLYRLFFPVQKETKRDWILFVLAGLGLCLWRTNGLLVYMMLFLVMVLTCRENKKIIIVMTAVLICALVLSGPVLSAMNIEGSDYVEMLSIPLQQIASVVHEGVPIEPEDMALIRTVAEPDVISKTYRNEISDPVKGLVRTSAAYEEIPRAAGTYLKLWLRLGAQNPGLYLKAWVDQTKGYWNEGYSYWIIARGIFENDLGLVCHQENIVGRLYSLLTRYMELIPFIHPLLSIGLHTWLLVICGFVSLKKKRKTWLLAVPGLAVVLGLMI